MAEKKLKKFPRKPKASASIAAKEAFLQKVKEVKQQNAKILSDRKKSKELDKRIEAAIKGCR